MTERVFPKEAAFKAENELFAAVKSTLGVHPTALTLTELPGGLSEKALNRREFKPYVSGQLMPVGSNFGALVTRAGMHLLRVPYGGRRSIESSQQYPSIVTTRSNSRQAVDIIWVEESTPTSEVAVLSDFNKTMLLGSLALHDTGTELHDNTQLSLPENAADIRAVAFALRMIGSNLQPSGLAAWLKSEKGIMHYLTHGANGMPGMFDYEDEHGAVQTTALTGAVITRENAALTFIGPDAYNYAPDDIESLAAKADGESIDNLILSEGIDTAEELLTTRRRIKDPNLITTRRLERTTHLVLGLGWLAAKQRHGESFAQKAFTESLGAVDEHVAGLHKQAA